MRYFTRSDFARNVGVMFSGNAVAMVLPFVLAPLISRIYTPEDFASFELFVKIVGLIAVVGSLRLEFAILLPRAREEALALVRLCFKVLLWITAITGLIFILLRHPIANLLNNAMMADLIWLLPLGVLSVGALNIMNQWLIREREFKEASFAKITAAAGNNLGKYGLGLFMANAFGLTIGHIMGSVIPLAAMARLKRLRASLADTGGVQFSTRALFRKYKDFPLVNSSHAFYQEGQQTVLLSLISAYYGGLALGLFAFSLRYLRVPVVVFGTSIAQVLNEKWARDLNEGRSIRPSVKKILAILTGLALVPFSVLYLFGEPLFAFVFGDRWAEAGTYAQIMAPWLFCNFVVSPITMIPVLLKRQAAFFRIAIAASIITLSAVWAMSLMDYAFTEVLWVLSLLNAAIMVYITFWLLYISGHPRQEKNDPA